MAEPIVESSTETVLNVARTERIRVLHVDDDQAFLKVAKQCLDTQGEFEVDTASSVNEALEELKKTDYDAIVSDYQMPGKDGLEFLKELRKKGKTVPFIVFTGKGREEIAIKALNLGADQYISKSGDPETVYGELAHSIRVAVEQKKAEKTLSAERDKLETVTGNIGAGLAIISKDYRSLWANDVLKQIFGDVEGKICYSTYNQRNDICPKCGAQEIFETGKVKVVHEQVGKDVDGKTVWSEITATPIKDRDGNVTAVLELVVPITQRKAAEAELRDSEEKYRSLVELAPDGIVAVNAEGIVTSVNRSFLTLLGYDSEEIVGKPFTELKSSRVEDIPKMQELFKSLMNGESPSPVEFLYVRRDGTSRWAEVHPSLLVKDGNPVGAQVIMRDVTERKNAEEKLRSLKEFNEGIVDSIVDSLLVIDPNDYGIISVNEAALKQLMLRKEDLIGKTCYETTHHRSTPCEPPLHICPIHEMLKTGKTVIIEHTHFDEDNNEIFVEVSAHPIRNQDGNIVQAVHLARDITERKKVEEEKSRLLHDFHERAKELNCLYDMSRLVEKSDISLDDTLQGTADLLPPALQYPNITCARVVVENREFSTKNFKETRWKLQADIKILGKKAGFVEVRYLEERPTIAEGPFQKEERHLIDAIAERLGRYIERKKAEDALRDAQEKWASLTENTDDIIMIVDGNGIIQFINRTIPPYTPEETIGKPIYEYVPKEQHDVLEKALRGVFKTGNADKYEVSSNIPTLGTLCFSTRIVPIKQDGNISGAVLISANITDQKKAREENEKASETWRTTFDAISDFVFVLDKGQRFVRVNKALCEALKKESKELIGKRCFEVLHGTNEPWPSCPFRKTLVTKRTTTEEVNDPNLGIPLLVTVSPIFDGEGVFAGVVHIAKDITEQKKIEKVLRDSEERLSILFELAPDAYYLNDLKGNFIDGNKAAEELTGYMKNELIGKSFLRLKLLPRSQALKAAKLLAMNALGKPTGPDEFVLNRKGGTQIPVEIRTHPVKIKGKTLVLGIARDITIRKKNEQAILESQQKFEGLFRHNPEAAVHLDLDSKILDVNPRFCELFGYSAKEVEGKRINEVVAPEDMIEEAETLDKDLKKGYASRDTVRKRKDGSLVHVSISGTPVTIEGRLFGYVGVYKDITDLKNAQEHLKEINRRLEVTNEKLNVVGSLTRHDVRNKLSAVTGNAYLLRRKLTEDPKALEQLKDIEAAVRLVERIFEFARVYERLGVEQLANLDFGEAVAGAVSLFSDLKGVRIVNECGGLTVLADSLLRQLLYNLIDNSLKYGEKIRQIKIYCKTPSADKLDIVYEDDGSGIPDNMRSNLFKEGFTSGKGTGYGLFMIRRICEVYGWTIQETGKQGKGVQFTMSIPRTGSTGKANYQIRKPRQHQKDPETNVEVPNARFQQPSKQTTVTMSDWATTRMRALLDNDLKTVVKSQRRVDAGKRELSSNGCARWTYPPEGKDRDI